MVRIGLKYILYYYNFNKLLNWYLRSGSTFRFKNPKRTIKKQMDISMNKYNF